MRKIFEAMVAAALLAAGGFAFSQEPAKATRDSGVYRVGEPVEFGLARPLTGSFAVLIDGNEVARQGQASAETPTAAVSLDRPGWVLLVQKSPEGKSSFAGAIVAPREIKPAVPPDDFDAFWDAQAAALGALPLNAVVEKIEVDPAVDYYRVRLDGPDGTHVRGQLARPKGPDKLPALITFQWAGVYPLQPDWAVARAKQGFIVYNLSAHDIDLGAPESTYKQLAETSLANYVAIGETNRETSYFRRMLLGGVRAADYLAGRDDWNGRTLAVSGSSQGGLLAIAAAALNPKVTHALVNVPAGCGTTARYADAWWPWPYWHGRAHAGKSDADRQAVLEASRYFDAANFAHRVRVPVLAGVALADTVSPAPGVMAMVNGLAGPIDLVVMPRANHTEGHDAFQRRYEIWLDAVQHGKPLPLKKETP